MSFQMQSNDGQGKASQGTGQTSVVRRLACGLAAGFVLLGLIGAYPVKDAMDSAGERAWLPQDVADSDPALWHFKERRPLAIDRSRIAIFDSSSLIASDIASVHPQGPPLSRGVLRDDPSTRNVRALAAKAGLDESALSREALPGWWLLDLTGREMDGPGVMVLTETLAYAADNVFVTPVFHGPQGEMTAPSPWLLVRFTADTAPGTAADVLAQESAGEVVEADFGGLSNTYRVWTGRKSGLEVLALAESLARRPEVRFAEPDMMLTGRNDFIPNDPLFGSCWGLHNTGQPVPGFQSVPDMDMDLPEAWEITTGDPGILILVLDNGVQQDHPDIHQIPGIDVTGQGGGGGPVNPCDNHGTAIGGILSAMIDNGIGAVGVAPNATVVSARVTISRTPCDGSWMGMDSWFVTALDYGQSIGARVTNNSTGYWTLSSAVEDKFVETRAAGMVHFAATGNNGGSSIHPVAAMDGVNAVAALVPDGTLANFSNYGVGLDYAAPGVYVCTTDRTGADGGTAGDYGYLYGTSAASPCAAGVAALVLSVNPSLTAAEVETVMNQSCMDRGEPGYDTTYGWGFVNAFGAVQLATVPAATVTGAMSRKVCDIGLALTDAVTSEPRQGGVAELRIEFDTMPAGFGASPVSLEERVCPPPGSYGPYTGGAQASSVVEGNELVVNFDPPLENGRTYRLTLGPGVTTVSGQFVEVRALMGDVNSDGAVNATDRSLVVGTWTGSGYSCATDTNGDGATNATDRSAIVGAWTGGQNCSP